MDEPTTRGTALKIGPCGAAVDERGTAINVFQPGETITVSWHETINHPSTYRISFDADGTDDFADPATPDDFYTNDAVLIDEIPDTASGEYSVQVTLPPVACENCTLQLIQLMLDKPPYEPGTNDLYYQCADSALRGETIEPTGTDTDTGAPGTDTDTDTDTILPPGPTPPRTPERRLRRRQRVWLRDRIGVGRGVVAPRARGPRAGTAAALRLAANAEMSQKGREVHMNPRPKDANPGSMPFVAAVALGFTGVAVTLLAVQFLTLWALTFWHQLFVGALLVGGVLAVFTARNLLEARPWAAILGSLLAPAPCTLATTVWAVYALWNWSLASTCSWRLRSPRSPRCCARFRSRRRSGRIARGAVFRGTSLLGAIDS